MKKLILFAMAFVLGATIVWAAGHRQATPLVRYTSPKNESTIELTKDESIEFKWKNSPMPGGGRDCFKFNIYKGFSYEIIVEEKLKSREITIEIPAEKLEDGQLYTWQVKQRDRKTRYWSADQRWTFTVKK